MIHLNQDMISPIHKKINKTFSKIQNVFDQYSEPVYLDENANPIKKSSAEPVKPAATAMPNETDAETARLARQNAASMPTTSNALNTVMAENVAANLPSVPNKQAQTTVNNVIQNKNNQQQRISKLSEIAVHNDEPTFMRMIMGSTRLV